MRRHGFTLLELLVALAIIATLVALLVPAVAIAVNYTRRSTVTAEIQQTATGMADMKGKVNQPGFSIFIACEDGDYSAANIAKLGLADGVRIRQRTLDTMRKFWPRARFSEIALANRTACDNITFPISGIGWYDFNGNGVYDAEPYLVDGFECLVLCLGGISQPFVKADGSRGWSVIGFANSPTNPFQPASYIPCGGGGEITPSRTPPYMEFNSGRLFDADGDGMPALADTFSGSEQPTPYAFFVTMGGEYDPNDCNLAAEPDGSPAPVAAFKTSRGIISSPAPNPYTTGPALPVTGSYTTGTLNTGSSPGTVWAKSETYQIISAGPDRRYGPGGQFSQGDANDPLPFPRTANTAATGVNLPADIRQGERDNLTNLATGVLAP